MSKSVFLVSECGTGKSLMGCVAAHIVGQKVRPDYRVLVVGPPHLTRAGKNGSKWHREITGTIPDAITVHIETHEDLIHLPARMAASDKPMWVICSRNFLKLGPPWRAAFNLRTKDVTETLDDGSKITTRRSVPVCPHCGSVVKDADDVPVDDAWLHKGQRECKGYIEAPDESQVPCKSKLWEYTWPLKADGQANKSKPLLFPAGYLKKKCHFDIGIFDEVHELKGAGTAQGQMLGTVAAACDRLIALTGTLFGGKASDLYYLMWRLCPERMRALGFEYKGSEQEFVGRYGILQRVVDPRDADVRGKRSKEKASSNMCEKIGIVPTLFTDLLLDRAVFLSLDELVPHLPPGMLPPRPRIEILPCPMGELEGPYNSLEGQIRTAIKESSRGGSAPNMGLVAALFNGADCWPDHPFDWADMYTKGIDEDGTPYDKFVCSPPNLPDLCYEKDQKLVQIVKGEVAKGRRCLVYTVHTQKHPVTERIKTFLEREGIACAILEGVATDKREDWVAKQKAAGVQVIITHPAKVETGLDLLDWPTIIFHSIGLKPFTFRQAGARAWRIGQKAKCRIIVLCYAGSMQQTIAGLMMQKLKAATRLEGQILEDLAEIGGGEDITDQILKSIDGGERPALAADIDEEIIIIDEPEPELVPVLVNRVQREAPDVIDSLLGDLLGFDAPRRQADDLDAMLADLMG